MNRPHAFPVLPAILVLPFLLAGCVGDSGGKAHLGFDGTGNGQESDTTECDDDGTVVGTGQVDEGRLTIRVTDDGNRELYEQEFDGGLNVDSERVRGDGGTWRLEVVRAPDAILGAEFAGEYDVTLSC